MPTTRQHRDAARLAFYGNRPSKHLQILRWVWTGEVNAGVSEALPRIAQAIADATKNLCANCLLGDEPPKPGEMREGTGEPGCYLCDECFQEWRLGQAEGTQW